MANEYEVTSTTGFEADVADIVLEAEEQTQDTILDPYTNVDISTTRRVLRARIVYNQDKSMRRVNMAIVHQRRHKVKEDWKDVEGFKLSQLKGGEEAKIRLDAQETYALFEVLRDLYNISARGIPQKAGSYTVLYNATPGVNLNFIREFVEFLNNGGEDVWKAVKAAKLRIPAALAHHRLLELRQQVIIEFEQHIGAGDWDEGQWQTFFTKNNWIFGDGLAYQFLATLTDQPYYGGKNLIGRDGQRGDYLMVTQADARFTVLVEIKRPNTLLLAAEKYRNKVYRLSEDLTGGVSQMQSNCRTWSMDGARQEDNQEMLEDISTYQPKGILVIGNTAELAADSQKRATFELFRRNLQNPEIVTFDELLARARFLVSHQLNTIGSEP